MFVACHWYGGYCVAVLPACVGIDLRATCWRGIRFRDAGGASDQFLIRHLSVVFQGDIVTAVMW